MKKLLFSVLCVILSLNLFGQVNSVQDFHEKYKSNGKYFNISVEGGILKLAGNVETNDPEAQELLDILSKIDEIDIHSIDRAEADFDEIDFKNLVKGIKKEKFEELVVVKDGDDTINFYVKESGGEITDLLLLVDGHEEFIILNISGIIDLKTISKLSEHMDMKGMDHLDDMNKDR